MLYENISARCREKGIRISNLERAAGLANATVRRWSTSSPSVNNLKKVADVLDCTIDDLLCADEAEEQKN